MKMNFVVKVCVLAFFGASLSNTCIADTGFSSGEIKKVRHLSRALLQSRALERKRIEAEVAPQRVDIKKMEDRLDQLIATESLNMMQVSLEKTNNSNSAEAVFHPIGSVAQETPQLPVDIDTVKSNTAEERVNQYKKSRVERINASKNAIASMRLKTEEKLPSKLAFWRSKTKHDIRNQHVVDVASSVEQALTEIAQQDRIDVEDLRVLKDRLTLKKSDIKFDDIDPTIHTRTRHRVQ